MTILVFSFVMVFMVLTFYFNDDGLTVFRNSAISVGVSSLMQYKVFVCLFLIFPYSILNFFGVCWNISTFVADSVHLCLCLLPFG